MGHVIPLYPSSVSPCAFHVQQERFIKPVTGVYLLCLVFSFKGWVASRADETIRL